MGQEDRKGHSSEISFRQNSHVHTTDFVLEKSIFSNIFEKDIRRVFIYKKAERLAKGLHLIAPAFAESVSLKNRLDSVAITLIDTAILPPAGARTALARELLALSSLLALARSTGLLSPMNADLITREVQFLLQEVASYEEPRLLLEESPTFGAVSRQANLEAKRAVVKARGATVGKRHIKDIGAISDNRDENRSQNVLSIIRGKGGKATIKDISTLIRGVSEKTVQRELSALVASGALRREGQRRWSSYVLP